jgi:hypothetical protein
MRKGEFLFWGTYGDFDIIVLEDESSVDNGEFGRHGLLREEEDGWSGWMDEWIDGWMDGLTMDGEERKKERGGCAERPPFKCRHQATPFQTPPGTCSVTPFLFEVQKRSIHK